MINDAARYGGRYGQRLSRLGPDHPDTQKAKVDHRVARIRAFAHEMLDGIDPLTDEHVASVVAVLRGVAA